MRTNQGQNKISHGGIVRLKLDYMVGIENHLHSAHINRANCQPYTIYISEIAHNDILHIFYHILSHLAVYVYHKIHSWMDNSTLITIPDMGSR